MSTEFSKFAKLLREAEPKRVMDSDGGGGPTDPDPSRDPVEGGETAPAEGGETETVEGGDTTPVEETLDVNAWAEWVNTSITEDADKQEIWAALFTEPYPSVWTTEDILDVVNDLTPQQHVYVYANLVQGTSLTELINGLSKSGQKRLSRMVKFNESTVGETTEYVIERPDIVDGHVQTIRSMDEFDEENEKTSAAVIEALSEKDYIRLIKELSKEQTGKWWQLPGVNKIVNWSKKLDRKNQIQNTVNDMEAAKVIEMLTAIDKALAENHREYMAGGSGKEAQDSFAQSQTIGASYTPEGDIIEELFGFGAGTFRDIAKIPGPDVLQKLAIRLIKSKPEDDETKAVVALIVDAAMSHKESDAIYNDIQNLPQLKLMASVIAKGKPIKAKQAEDDHDAAVEKIAKQAERDKADAGLGAPMTVDTNNTKLGNLGNILREELAKRNKSE